MSTITTVPTTSLRPGDTLLVGASTVTVDRIELDEFDDYENGYWLYATCHSGNFAQWEDPRYVFGGEQLQVLDADRDTVEEEA